MNCVWHNVKTEGNPKQDGRYKVRAYNGYVCELDYEVGHGGYWHTVGYQSDIIDWAEI